MIRSLPKVTPQAMLRVAADAIIINVALLLALSLRYVNSVAQTGHRPDFNPALRLREYADLYVDNYWLITGICLAIFALSGFYTYGRAYRGRFKALVVAQAVSSAYLVYGAFAFGLRTGVDAYFVDLQWTGGFTFALWVLSWFLTLSLLMAARMWSVVWSRVKQAESALHLEPRRPLKNVLVLGGGGYIGSALLPKLLEDKFNVRIMDMMLYGVEPIQEFLDNPSVQLIRADFRQIDEVVRAMRDVDAVIHLGALVGDPACALDEELTIEINLMATRMIAEVAKGCGVRRFLFASTCSVYGASNELLDERSRLNPVSLYAKSKIASEKVLLGMQDDDFVCTCLRFGTIYGFSGRTRFDLVINLLAAKAVMERKITLYGGDQWRPFLHVDDAALAVLRALEAPPDAVRGQIFNVGSDEQNYTLQQVAEMIQAQVPEAEVLELGQDSDRRNYRVNFQKIREILGFKPSWTVEMGVAQVLEAIKTGAVTDYHDPRYSNVKVLTEEGTSRLVRRERSWAHELLEESSPLESAAPTPV